MSFGSTTRLVWAIGFSMFLAFVGLACQRTVGDPVSPTVSNVAPSGSAAAGQMRRTASSPYGGNALRLVQVGTGDVLGIVNATQTGTPDANNFELTVNVHGAPPDTDLYFQISGDTNPATRGDGVCPPAFPNPPAHAGGDAGILHTSAGGAAAAHLKFPLPEGFAAGAFDSGATSDFRYRVVNQTQTFDVRTDCTILTGK